MFDGDALVKVREWLASPTAPRGSAAAAAALGVLGVAGLHAAAPYVVVTDDLYDVFIPLDGAWRTVNGQVPHRDFETPIGALYYAVFGATMAMAGPTARVLLYAPVLVGLALLVPSLAVAHRRLPAPLAAVFAAYPPLLALSPSLLDRDAYAHLAAYNRWGWAFATLGALVAVVPPRERRPADDVGGGLLLAVLLLATFFTKVTYAGLLAGALGLALVLVPDTRRAVALGLGAAALALAALFALSSLPGAYLADLQGAIASRDPALTDPTLLPGPYKLMKQLYADAPLVLAALGGALLLSRTAPDGDKGHTDRAILLVAGLVAGGLVVAVQNHDLDVPFLVVPVAVVAAAAFRAGRGTALASLALLGLLGWRVAGEATGVLGHFVIGYVPGSYALTEDAASPLAPLRYVGRSADGEPPIRLVEDGAVSPEVFERLATAGASDHAYLVRSLVRELSGEPRDARVLVLWFSQPVAWATGRPAPARTLAWYDPGRTFGGAHPLDPSVVLADVDVVADPRVRGEDRGPAVMWNYLGDAIERDFVADERGLWRIWRRREGTGTR